MIRCGFCRSPLAASDDWVVAGRGGSRGVVRRLPDRPAWLQGWQEVVGYQI